MTRPSPVMQIDIDTTAVARAVQDRKAPIESSDFRLFASMTLEAVSDE